MQRCSVVDTPTISAVRRFLSLLSEGAAPDNEALAQALDELAVAYHHAPEGSPADDDRDPPDWDFKGRYAALRERFLSLVSTPSPTQPKPLTKRRCVATASMI